LTTRKIEFLVLAKRAAGRPRDLADLSVLERVEERLKKKR